MPPSPAAKPSAVNSGRRDEQLEAARLAASSGDWKAARAICLSLLESDPTPPGILLVQLAISEFMLGSVDRAGPIAVLFGLVALLTLGFLISFLLLQSVVLPVGARPKGLR